MAKIEIVVLFDTEKNEVATRWTNAPKGLIINTLATAIQSVVNQPEAKPPQILVAPGHNPKNGGLHVE